ncbi:MAG: hypothetical protein HOW73_24785 [Polyangiaceae bacterium]|nr:hypothetical protein [Polyangiaceae bacterium]
MRLRLALAAIDAVHTEMSPAMEGEAAPPSQAEATSASTADLPIVGEPTTADEAAEPATPEVNRHSDVFAKDLPVLSRSPSSIPEPPRSHTRLAAPRVREESTLIGVVTTKARLYVYVAPRTGKPKRSSSQG